MDAHVSAVASLELGQFKTPFRNRNIPLGDNFQFGGSFSYNDADRNDVAIQAVTPGLTPFFDVASRAKFNIIRDAD